MYLNSSIQEFTKWQRKTYSFFFVLFSSLSYSQKIDSLESLLGKSGDTVKVKLLNELSRIYFEKGNYEKSESLANDAKIISEKMTIY